MNNVDYLGWELERQRAALWALLGGGTAEGDHSVQGETGSPDGTRRSPADLGPAGTRGAGRAGRYAEGREAAGGPLMGAPGTWEMVREAERGALAGESGGLTSPEGAELPGEEAGSPARSVQSAETGVSALSLRRPSEGVRGTPRIGTGGAAEPWASSGGRGAGEAVWETAEAVPAETEQAAGAAGGKRAGRNLAQQGPAMETGGMPYPGEGPDGGGTALRASAAAGRERAGWVPSVRGGFTGAAGRQEGTFLPWDGRMSAVLQAEGGARALSRAVQRDARRYDGGFTIY